MSHPLESRPRGIRRVLQKLWADKDLRDEMIAQLESRLGPDAASFGVSFHLHAGESGAMTFEIVWANATGTHRRKTS